MKIRIALMVFGLLVALPSLALPGPVPPGGRLADLVIFSQTLTDPYGGEVSLQIRNKGYGHSKKCVLRLIVWEAGKFEQKDVKTVFVKVPVISAGTTRNVTIKAGVPIISTKYSLYVDISNQVPESNENNNRAEGESGKF